MDSLEYDQLLSEFVLIDCLPFTGGLSLWKWYHAYMYDSNAINIQVGVLSI